MTSEGKLAESLGIPVEIRQVSIDTHVINFLTAGSGRPLLLIHGANIGWGQWYCNIPELAKRFKVYALDLPGAGRSSRINYNILDPQRDLLHVVEKFVELLGLNNFSIVGSSIGGWIAIMLTLKYSEFIDKIVVVNSVGFADYMGINDKVIGFFPFAKLVARLFLNPKRSNKRVESFLRQTFHDRSFPLLVEFVDYFYETMTTSHNLLFISRLSKLTPQLLLGNRLNQLKNRTLIVWGEKDAIMPLDKNKHNFDKINSVKKVVITNAGHFPSIEKVEEFNREIIDFLYN